MSGDVSTVTGTVDPFPSGGVVSSTAVPVSGSVQKGISNNLDNFLKLINKIGDVCVNNEVCVLFLTATFVSIGVHLLRKVVRAFGRGR